MLPTVPPVSNGALQCAEKQFKVLADAQRLHILTLLRTGEEQFGEGLLNQLQIGQPTFSHHMKVLCEAELVAARRDGKRICYSLNTSGCAALRTLADSFLSAPQVVFAGSVGTVPSAPPLPHAPKTAPQHPPAQAASAPLRAGAEMPTHLL